MGNWKVVYEIGLVVWIVFGLGYIFMLIQVIADSLRKPARKAAKGIKKEGTVLFTMIFSQFIRSKTSGRSSVVTSEADEEETREVEDDDSEEENTRAIEDTSRLDGRSNNEVGMDVLERPVQELVRRELTSEEDESEVNDTITSLRGGTQQRPSVLTSFAPHYPTQQTNRHRVRKSSSVDAEATGAAFAGAGAPITSGRRKRKPSASASLSQSSTEQFERIIGPQHRNLSLPEILRTTTLEEFLNAADKSQRDQMIKDMEIAMAAGNYLLPVH